MRGVFLKHKLYRDVCFQVLKCFPLESSLKLKIEWWNLGCIDSYNMGLRQNTQIERNDFHNWEYTHNYEGFACLRNASWKELKYG